MNKINNMDELINYVVSNIDSRWDKLTQARYVYIEVGKHIQRYSDFFYSLDTTKMQELSLSISKLKEIYEDDKSIHNEEDWNKVICKSIAIILKSIFDMIGIDSRILKTIKPRNIKSDDGKESFDLDHYFVSINVDGKNYFLTLAPDLFNIQNGFETEHYGGYVPNFIENEDGTLSRYYEGELIEPELITKEELIREDYLIGYLNSFYPVKRKGYSSDNLDLNYSNKALELLSIESSLNEFLSEKTKFYRSLTKFRSADRFISFNLDNNSFSSLSDSDWSCYLDILDKFVIKKFSELINMPVDIDVKLSKNYDLWIKSVSQYLGEYLKNKYGDSGSLLLRDDFNFDTWIKVIKKDYKDSIKSSNSPIVFVNMVNTFVKIIINRDFNKREFNVLLHNLSNYYVPKRLIYDKKRYVCNEFIARKLCFLFDRVFDINGGPTDFNNLGYMEQMDTIKKVILAMFKDLTLTNVGKENYNGKYNLPFNRIMIYPLKNKSDGHYAMVFGIISVTEPENAYYLLYDNTKNTLEFIDALDIKGRLNYEILSDRFRNVLGDLEYDISQKKHTI